MPTVKRAEKFMDRLGAAILAIVVVGGAVPVLLMDAVGDVFWKKIIGVVWFVGTVAALFWLMTRMSRRFKCPDCGGAVGPVLDTDGKAGTPLLRHCAKCNVLWQVGAEPD